MKTSTNVFRQSLALSIITLGSALAATPPAILFSAVDSNNVSSSLQVDASGAVTYGGACNATTCPVGRKAVSSGQISISATVGPFKISSAVLQSKPLIAAGFDLGIGSVTTGGLGGTLTASFTDTGFIVPAAPVEYHILQNGTTSTYSAWLDPNNVPFGMTTPIFTIQDSAATTDGVSSPVTGYNQPVSLTASSTVTLGPNASYSNNFGVKPPPPLVVTCQANNVATVGVPYSSGPMKVTGGTPPYKFSIIGTLPPGLTLNTGDGSITGTPTAPGTFMVLVTDSKGVTGKNCTITVNPPGSLIVTCQATTVATVGVPYSSGPMNVTGGTPPYKYSVVGTLPPGLTLNPNDGSITGTPTAPGTFVVLVTDSKGNTGKNCTITVNPGPLQVTCQATTVATVGVPYSSGPMNVTGGTPPYKYSVVGTLPPGLTLNPNDGSITGTPTAPGTFVVLVTDSKGNTGKNCTITVNPGPLQVTCQATTVATVGVPYSSGPMNVTGGTPPYKYSVVGTLPPGLTLNPNDGSITGTPTAPGTFVVLVTDSKGNTGKNCTITVNPGPLTVTCQATNVATVGVPYSSGPMKVTGGTPPYVYSIIGTLPPGLTLNTSDGSITGTPTAPGSFAVLVTDSQGNTGKNCTITVNPGPLTVTCQATNVATVGVPYSSGPMKVTGGTPPYVYSIIGTLPPGLTLNPNDGSITGTPTAPGSFAVLVTDSQGNTGKNCTITVNPGPLTVTCQATTVATVGVPYSSGPMNVTGGTPPYKYSVVGTLPPGLTLNPNDGSITGTPTAPGTFVVLVTDSQGNTGKNCTITVNPGNPPTLSCSATNSAQLGTFFTSTVNAVGGTPPYVFSIVGGTLPAGLTLKQPSGNGSSATISGTPTALGTFYVQVTDANKLTSTGRCPYTVGQTPVSCVLPYPTGSAPALSSVVFNESGVLQAFAAAPDMSQVRAWFSDEHAPLLGARMVSVITSAGTTTTDYSSMFTAYDPASPAAYNANAPLPVGTTAPSGSQAGVDTALQTSAYNFGVGDYFSGRPLWPSLFITDLTANGPTSMAGDWQQGGKSAVPPNGIYGTWKGATVTIDQTKSPKVITVTTDADPAQNGSNLPPPGIPDTPPGGFGQNLGYFTEATWNVKSLGLIPGHTYRMQVIVHDGDQNKSGGDVGEACLTGVTIPISTPKLNCAAATGNLGVPYNSALVASGGVGPYTYKIIGTLPPGLTLDPTTGAITGIPTATGAYSFTSQATDASGNTVSNQCTITINGSLPLTLSCSPVSGQVGSPLNSPGPTVNGGTAPYTFSVVGTLPAGLSLDPNTGAITGTPATAGSFSIQVTDSTGATATSSCPYLINSCLLSKLGVAGTSPTGAAYAILGLQGAKIELSSGPLQVNGDVGIGANGNIHLSGGAKLNSTLYADPSATVQIDGGSAFTGGTVKTPFGPIQQAAVSQSNAAAALPATQTFSKGLNNGTTITGNGGLNVISITGGDVHLSGGQNLMISGGPNDSFVFNITGGFQLDGGANVVLNGVSPSQVLFNFPGSGSQIQTSGKANTAGIFLAPTRTIQINGGVHNSEFIGGGTLSFQSNPVVNPIAACAAPPLSLSCPATTGVVGTPYSSSLTATGGVPPYTFSIPGDGLPTGLALVDTAAGTISGTPITAGSFNFTGEVMDSSGIAATNTVDAACLITTGSTPPFACVIPPSQTIISGTSWNKFSTQGSNNIVWIHAHIGTPSGLSTTTTTEVDFTGVTFVQNGITYALPDGQLIFDPAASSTPSTSFDPSFGANGRWTTTLNPGSLSDEIFFVGGAVPVDSNITSGGNADFSFTTSSNSKTLSFSWQWSAAVYTYWPTWTGAAGTSPNDGNNLAQIEAYHGGEHAGAPLNKTVEGSLIGGPRGGGGSNYTGSWSATGHATCVGNTH